MPFPMYKFLPVSQNVWLYQMFLPAVEISGSKREDITSHWDSWQKKPKSSPAFLFLNEEKNFIFFHPHTINSLAFAVEH